MFTPRCGARLNARVPETPLANPIKHARTRRPSIRPLASSIAALLLAAGGAKAQTYTSPSNGTFTNPLVWNLGAGPVPVSDAGLVLNFLAYNSSALTATNDLNLTLNTLNLATFGSGSLTIGTSLLGDFAFAGAAQINLLGSGASSTVSAPIVLGSTATGLTFDGAGASGVTIIGSISSNTSAGAPITIATDAGNAGTGVVTLSVANTFAGGVVLGSGTFALGSARALGDRANVLTVNGGSLRSSSSVTLANNVVLNSTLSFNSGTSLGLAGVISGSGGVASRASGAGVNLDLRGINTYSGATSVGATAFAQAGVAGASSLRIFGAAASILGTSGVSVDSGGQFDLSYSGGHSASNSRIAAGTAIGVQSGFVQVVGNAGLIRQNLGTVTAGGLTALLANTSATTTGTEVTIANLVRSAGGTVVFQGANLGKVAVGTGLAAAQGNIFTTQINGAAPAAALVGGSGGAGTAQLKIVPWALGDTTQTVGSTDIGAGFVTYDTNGVRLLDATTEYNSGNNFTTVGATDNMRITSTTLTNPTGPTTVNSLFFATSGATVAGGANVLTITSGALASASNVPFATISSPVDFGAGEAVVSVVGAIGSTNHVNLFGGFSAGSLTKSGQGGLVINTVTPTLTGAFNINGGTVILDQVSRLGAATSLNFDAARTAFGGSALETTSLVPESLSLPITTRSGAARIVANGTLTVNSNISGAGAMRFDGPGTIVLSGTNSYSGGTFIAGSASGTVQIDGDARLGSTADPLRSFVVLETSGTLRLTGPWTSARAVAITAAATLDTQANAATLSGPITGNVELNKVGEGALTITSGVQNRYTATITLGSSISPGGTLALSGAGALNSASVTLGATGGPAGSYSFDLSGATDTDATDGSSTPWRSVAALNTATGFTQTHTVQLGASAGAPVDLRVGSGTFGGTTGVIAGFGKLVKVGTGTLTLSGATSTFTGGVEVRGGTLAFSNDLQLGNATNSIVIQGGILNSTASVTTSRGITLGATPQPIISGSTVQLLVNGINTAASTTLTLNGTIDGAGGFNKSGTGTLILGAATNTYAGDTQVTQGALSFTANNQLGAASSRVRLNGGTLQFSAAPGSPTIFPFDRALIVSAASTINVANVNARLQLGGSVNGSLTKTGPGQLIIAGANFRGSVIIGDGSTATGNVILSSTGPARIFTVFFQSSSGATFDMSGLTREISVLNLRAGTSLALGAGGKLTLGFNVGGSTLAGMITGDGAAAVTLIGPSTSFIQGTGWTFGGGLHQLSSSILTLGASGTVPLQSAITVGAWGGSTNLGAVLELDNTGTALSTRLADTQVIYSNSGTVKLRGISGVNANEIIGALRGAGMSTVDIRPGGTLNFASPSGALQRLGRGTFLFFSDNANMGTAAATPTIPNVLFANLPGSELVGGGGGAGTTTISILPYAAGGISLGDPGRSFVTYGANGIRVLTTAEYNADLVAAGAAENVRVANAALTTTTLGGGTDKTANSLVLAGTANTTRIASATAEKLILTSGALLAAVSQVWSVNAAGTAGVVLGVQSVELQTGAGNTRELIVSAAGDLTLGAKVTTMGGLTKSGASQLFLTNTANTYTGATTVNAGSLVVDTLAALGGSTVLQLGGGFLKYRGGDATLAPSVVATGGDATNPIGGSAGFHVVSGTTLTVPSGRTSGFGGVLKDGTGVLKLQGTNNHAGATILRAGAIAIDEPGALGTHGRFIFGESTISTNGGQTLRFDAPMTLPHEFLTGTSVNEVGFGFDTNGHDVTLTGTIIGSGTRGLYKFGAGELNLTAEHIFSGASQVWGGTLRLSGANGSMVSSTANGGFTTAHSVFVAPGAALVLDNAAANNNNRLPDVWDTPIGSGDSINGSMGVSGGEFKIIGNAGGTSERINQFNIFTGTVTLSGGGTTLTSGQFGRLAGPPSAGLIRGTNLGATPGATSANWFLTDLGSGGLPLSGAGGAEGTPFVNIARGFMGDASATGTGTDLVTYAADTGIRPLTPGEYAGTIPANNFDLNRAPNVALAGAATVNQTTAITALKLGAGASVEGSGTLLLSQHTVLATGNASINVPSLSTNVSGSIAGYVFLTSGAATTLTVASVLPSADITTYGEGTVALGGRALGSSTITVGQGTLRLDGAGAALNPLGSNVNVMPGATFDLGGTDRMIQGLTLTSTIGTFNLGQVSHGTVALGANRLTIYGSGNAVFTGSVTGSGGVTKAFLSTGTSTFTRPLAYTGSTIIRGGTFQLGGAGTLASTAVEVRNGTLIFNNTDDLAAAGGSVANRLGTSVPITLAGGIITFTENANTPGNHSLGPVTLAGGGRLTINNSTAPSTVTFANLIRGTTRGTLSVSATNLGLAQSPIGNARVFATQIEGAAPASALIGGGGAVGSTTQSILPWAASIVDGGFLTLGADGLRPLAVSEYAASLSGAGATENARTIAAQVLAAPTTVNSLLQVTAGGVSGSFDLTLTSGALASTATGTIGVNTNALLTGAGNARELVIKNNAGMTLDYNLTTSGGVTKFGTGGLTLGGTNTFTSGLTINDGLVLFTADTQLGAAGGAVRFGGTNVTTGLSYIGPAATPVIFTRPVETTSFGQLISSVANHRWQVNGVISGAGAFGYFGVANSIIEINAANTYTGATNWTGGHLYIRGDSAFGNGGELVLNAGAARNIVLRDHWTTSRIIHANNDSAIQTNGFDATWSGQFIGGSALSKNGTGALILTEAMPYTGIVTVNAGEVRLRDRGSLAANGSARNVNAGAAFTLDDTGAHFSDRLHDSTGGTILAGGELKLLGSSSATTEEVIFGLSTSADRAATVTVAAGSGQAAILRVAGTLAVNAGASLWRGTNLGVNAPGTANSATIILTETNSLQQGGLGNLTFLTGGAAPAGHPSTSIIKGGFGDTSASGLGTQLVTYDFERGIRLLDPATEFTTTLVNGSIVTDNVKADGATIALAHATTANALWLKDGGSLTGAGTLTLSAGNLLVTGTGNTLANPITAGANAFAVGGPGDVIASGAISGSGGLIKTGAGTLTLAVANGYTGATILTAGTVAVGHATAFNASAVQLQGGAIQNATAGPLSLANNLTLNGPMLVSGAQDLTFGGTVSVANATREINVTNFGLTTLSGVISSSQLLINYGLTKTGPGTLVLSNAANTYDGETTVNGGELRVTGNIATSTLTTVVSGTLSGTGTLGALQLDAGTLAPGIGGVGTLTAGNTDFSGGTFSLELASAASADQLVVLGTATFTANTALSLSLLGGYTPAVGDQWTIVNNDNADAIAFGAFRFTSAGVPLVPFAEFLVSGQKYFLNYAGGSGNDVVLVAVPEPGALAILAAALPLLGLARFHKRATLAA